MNPELQLKINEAIKYRDPERAREVLALARNDQSIVVPKPIENQLNYIRFTALNPEQIYNLLKSSIIDAFKINEYDLEQKIVDIFELLEYPPAQIDFLYHLKSILEQHQELLGNQKIVIKDKQYTPTIGNWILDYVSTIRKDSQDALGEMRYINSGKNLRILTIPQKKILQKILRIYDRTTQLIELWEAVPENLPPDQLSEFESWVTTQLKEGYGQEAVSEPASTVPPVKSVASVVVPEPITKSIPQPLSRKPVPIIPSQPDAPPLYKIGTKDKLNLETNQKKGLIYDTPTNIDIDKEAKAKLHRQAELLKIQVKLDDLKKRKRKSNS